MTMGSMFRLSYSTASDGSKLIPVPPSTAVPRRGRRRTPTGDCHAVPTSSPALTRCGLSTEGLALWPDVDFTEQRVQICPECRRGVLEAEQRASA